MNKMTSEEIIKLVNELIGETTACGESNADLQIDANLRKVIDVVNFLLGEVMWSAKTRHRCEGSMRQIGERAFSAMCDWEQWLYIVIGTTKDAPEEASGDACIQTQ